jgi:hypothetical protein
MKRLREAKYIDDVSWGKKGSQTWTQKDAEAYAKYQDTVSAFAKNPRSIWREIAVFHTLEHFEQERQRVLAENNVAYNLGFYEVPTEDAPNLRGFMIIDQCEVMINHDQQSIWVSIKHPTIVRYFLAYFEDLWQAAKKLKQGKSIDRKELERLEVHMRRKTVPTLTTD